jgi:hypothetical protein
MANEFQQADGVGASRVLGGSATAWFDAPMHTAGAALIERIAGSTDGGGLPDVDLRAGGVRVRIGAPGPPGLTPADVALARAVSVAADDLGLVADPAALQVAQLAVDAVDRPSVMSFWETALAYEPIGGDRLGDPLRRDPTVSFHHLEHPRPLRDRIHLDVSRTLDAVEAVKATTGRQAYGAWGLTLADAEGNEVDLVPGGELAEGPETADWRLLFGAMSFYPAASPVQASDLATVVARLADDAGVPLLVDLRPEGVTIDSGKDPWEDDDDPSKSRFTELAGQIQAAAHDMTLVADPTNLRFVQLCIDAVDVPAVRAFWTTVLGYQHDPRPHVTDIYDPRRLGPVIIFQPMDASEDERRRQRNRTHIDLLVPDDQAQVRIDAALAAGGRIVTDTTPGRCTVADPEGNELDILTEP